jgi:hypothetical protein
MDPLQVLIIMGMGVLLGFIVGIVTGIYIGTHA